MPGLAQASRPLVEVAGALFGPPGAMVMMAGMLAKVVLSFVMIGIFVAALVA
jgi:hypothetical protein